MLRLLWGFPPPGPLSFPLFSATFHFSISKQFSLLSVCLFYRKWLDKIHSKLIHYAQLKIRRLEIFILWKICVFYISVCVLYLCVSMYVCVCLCVICICIYVCLCPCKGSSRLIHRKHLLFLACVFEGNKWVQVQCSRFLAGDMTLPSLWKLHLLEVCIWTGECHSQALQGPWASISNPCVTVQHHTNINVHPSPLEMP